MNFLAHLALAGPADASRIGNLLGDFEKGTPEHLARSFPPEIVAGIVMHRQIDLFTDQHELFRAARHLLEPSRRRYAGILVDIFFDHFLALNWSRYYPGTVPGFIDEIHEIFDRHPTWLGDELGPLVPRFKNENWLAAYLTPEGLSHTFWRVSQRSPRLAPIAEAVPDLFSRQEEFEKLFLAFYPEVRTRARELLGGETMVTKTSLTFP